MRRLTVVMAAVLGFAGALPAGAAGATELGQVQATSALAVCEGPLNLVQRTTSPEVSYEVPGGGGVITSWRHRALPDEVSDEAAGGRLQVWRPTAAGFVLASRSAFEAFVPGVVNEFATQVPVAPGDLLGLRIAGKPVGCASEQVHGPADVVAGDDPEQGPAPDPATGFAWAPALALDSSRLNVAATLDVIELAVETAPKQKVKKLQVTMGCGPLACDAELGGKAVAKKGKPRRNRQSGGAPASKKGKKKFAVKPTAVQVAAGQTVTERVRLKKTGKLRKLLRNKAFRRKTKAKITVAATDAGGNTASEKAKVKLKP